MKKNIIIIIIVAVILIGGYFLFKATNQIPVSETINEQSNETQQVNMPIESNTIQIQEKNLPLQVNEVIYTDSGYSPSELKIKIGDTVTFKNESSSSMWTASAMHPSHIVYSGTSLQEHCPDTQNTSFDTCKGIQPKDSWQFTFDKIGKWGYHNHLMPSHFGKIVVE